MNPNVIEEAQRLLRVATADYTACVALLNATGVRFVNAAFQGQQAVEKSLKAVLIVRGVDVARTHNLLALVGQLAEVGEAPPVSSDQLSLLNPYAVTLRYDDIDVELISPEVLREIVEAVLGWAASIVDALLLGDGSR